FFGDFARLLTIPPCRSSLLAVSALRGLVTGSAGALIAAALSRGSSPTAQYQELTRIAILTTLGAGVGSILAGLATDRRRTLSLVPLGAGGLVLALGWIALLPQAPAWLCVMVGLCGGIVNVPLLSLYQGTVPADARGNGMAILNTAG